MTAVPLGQLRRECGERRSDRWYRPLGVAPFLLPAQKKMGRAGAGETRRLLLNLPLSLSPHLLYWTDADWHDPENLSALWDLSGHLTGTAGQVLWARGTHGIHDMPKIGLPAPEFLESAKS